MVNQTPSNSEVTDPALLEKAANEIERLRAIVTPDTDALRTALAETHNERAGLTDRVAVLEAALRHLRQIVGHDVLEEIIDAALSQPLGSQTEGS